MAQVRSEAFSCSSESREGCLGVDAMARVERAGLKICALDTLGETGAWGSAHRHALVSHILWPTGFPLSEPGCKTIPLRSRVSLEAERI